MNAIDGNPAVLAKDRRPVALRSALSNAVPFSSDVTVSHGFQYCQFHRKQELKLAIRKDIGDERG
jgi:hypothetical protein